VSRWSSETGGIATEGVRAADLLTGASAGRGEARAAAGEAGAEDPEAWRAGWSLPAVDLSGGSSLRGSTCTMAGATRPEAGSSWRPLQPRIASRTAGSSGFDSRSTLPSDCKASGTAVTRETFIEGTWTTRAASNWAGGFKGEVTLMALSARRMGSRQAWGRGANGSEERARRARSERATDGIGAARKSCKVKGPPKSSAGVKERCNRS
jgi:hypothetical protein